MYMYIYILIHTHVYMVLHPDLGPLLPLCNDWVPGLRWDFPRGRYSRPVPRAPRIAKLPWVYGPL